MHVDLNSCTTRQLAAIPGVQKQLATAIIRWRQQNGVIKFMDDLWNIDGMNRSKFQILSRHFYVASNHTGGENGFQSAAGVGDSQHGCLRPAAQNSFLCKGQSVHGDGIRVSTENKNDADQRSRRSEVKHRLTQSHDQCHKSREDLKKKTCCRSAVITGQSISTPRSSITSNPVNKTALPRSSPRKSACKNSLDTALTTDPPAVEDQQEEQPSWRQSMSYTAATTAPPKHQAQQSTVAADKPGFVLQPSESGNNINLTCTIDKRLLSNLNGPVSIGPADSDHAAPQKPETLRSLVDKMNSRDMHATSDYATLTSDSCKLTVADEGSQVNSLNLENLLRFDRCNRTSFEERMNIVSTWVDDVNRCRREGSVEAQLAAANLVKAETKPITLIKPGYLKELADHSEGPSPVVKVFVEKKATRGVRPTPTKTATNLRGDKAVVQTGHMTEHVQVAGTLLGGRPRRAISAAEKRQISAVLQPARVSPRAPTLPKTGSVPRYMQPRFQCNKGTTPSAADKSEKPVSKSQPTLNNRKTVAHKSSGNMKTSRPASKSPRMKTTHSLIHRIWTETQGQSSGSNLLRKPLSPRSPRGSPPPKSSTAKGRHFLHQFSFMRPPSVRVQV